MEPAVVSLRLANVQPVDTTGKRVEVENDMYSVFLNSVCRNVLDVGCLVTGIELAAGELDPSSVGSRDAKNVDAPLAEQIDIIGSEERGVSFFEHRTALRAQTGAETPFVASTSRVLIPPVGVDGLLLLQPASLVDAAAFECRPIDILGRCEGKSRETRQERGDLDNDRKAPNQVVN